MRAGAPAEGSAGVGIGRSSHGPHKNTARFRSYHSGMTETPEQNPTHALDESEPAAVSHAISREPITVQSSSANWLAPLAAVISLIAAGLAAWALVKASAANTASVVPGDGVNPKATVCTAFEKVVTAVSLQTHTDLGPEPVPQLAVAANARLALLGGGQYLLSRIPDGAPKELAGAVRSFAANIEEVGMNYLAGKPDNDQAQVNLQADSQAQSAKIIELCK